MVMDNNHATPVIGIDLGTTYSVVATVDNHGQPQIIPNTDNQRTTPSVIYIDGNNVVVGNVAKEQLQVSPRQTVQFIKPFIGRRRKRFQIGGQEWAPEELSAMILRKVVQDAQMGLGLKAIPRHCVITVPAFFSEQQRKSTEDAGRIAGLDVMSIINEPTAAALAYGFNAMGQDKTVLVYDLGGGTFDVTVMRVTGDAVIMLATDGDVQLGGKDWDERIIDHVCETFAGRHGIDPRDDPDALQGLYYQTEQAKLRLSKLPMTRIQVTCQGKTDTVDLTRDQFEEMTEDLLSQTETTLQLTLDQAKLDYKQVDEVLLVGGSTRMRAVRAMLEGKFGHAPQLLINPDECVAHGAAIHAVMTALHLVDQGHAVPVPDIAPEHLDRFRRLEERLINPHTLGILALDENQQRVVVPIIERGTLIPCRQVRVFHTPQENQQQIRIMVMEGENPQPEACVELGTLLIQGLPEGLAKGSPIEVVFDCSQDGRLNVTANLPTLQQTVETQIARTMGMTDETIEFARLRLTELVIQ
jgi:molecular chaperone DnaK